jgi:hypothetical protein
MRTTAQIESHLAETTERWDELSTQDQGVLIELDRLAERFYEEVRIALGGTLPFEDWKKMKPG